jgi:hypothetical protein
MYYDIARRAHVREDHRSSTNAQKPAMQTFGGSLPVGGQQSTSCVQRSSRFEHIGTSEEHMPTAWPNSLFVPSEILQNPPQQSMPVVHVSPSRLHGSSAANARWLPVPNSWPGK